MFEKWVERISLLVFLALALIGTALAVLILRMLKINDPAAWAQAFGSVVAIFAAFVVSDRHFKKSTEADAAHRAAEDDRHLEIIDAVLHRISDIAIELYAAMKRGDRHYFEYFNPKLLVELKRSLTSIPILDIPAARVVVPITALPQAMDDLIDTFQRAREEATSDDLFYDALVAHDLEDSVEGLHHFAIAARAESATL